MRRQYPTLQMIGGIDKHQLALGRAAIDAELEKIPPLLESGRFLPAEGQLPTGIDLFPSPGHTLGHCSLLADTQWGPLIVCGDAVMTPEFCEAEEGFHNSIDFEQAADTIRAIKGAARLIIPGHGNVILNL